MSGEKPGELMNWEASPLIHLHYATVYRATRPVIHELSLVIASGCSTVILGPNGSGKSIPLKVFSKELYPVGGPDRYVRLMGQES